MRTSKRVAFLFAVMLCLPAAMCQTTGGFPSRQDVVEVTEPKPRPEGDILNDPEAGDLYDSAIEGWGDRIHAAGMRLCRFYERTGMPEAICQK